MSTKGAVLVAIAATIGNFLQGWDNATIAGAIVYIKQDMTISTAIEGLIVAMSLIGATVITTCSGAISDAIGRRPMLILSSTFYFVSGLVMLWSPNVYVLLVARLLDGFGIGLAVTLVPVYISETSPPEIRGLLNTLPQFTGVAGMLLAYIMIFLMSLGSSPSWRLMLGVLSIPSVLYVLSAIFYLPESPRWLVSKGRMAEARIVLQRLRGVEDVQGELALLVEGLGVGADTTMEEYEIAPADGLTEDHEKVNDKDKIKLYGSEAGLSWIAKPAGQSALSMCSHQGSMVNKSVPGMDPLVNLFGSVHEKAPGGSMMLPNFGSMLSNMEIHAEKEMSDEENQLREDEYDYAAEPAVADFGDNVQSPLLDKDMVPPSQGSNFRMGRGSSVFQGPDGEPVASAEIGSGWQLTYADDGKDGGLKRIYLHQQDNSPASRGGSRVSMPGSNVFGNIHASALVSRSALYSKEILDQHAVGPAMVHPAETASKGPSWRALLDPGVKRALVVGVGIQFLQQFSGINGVMYYTPQILEQAGVEVLLLSLGLSSTSASFLISGFTTFLMLPCIMVAMRLMDVSGRRSLLLYTIPILIVSLIILVIGQVVDLSSVLQAVISTACVVIYFCCFVTAYGPIPNILCSEIFPTRVRGLCIAITALVYWICDIIVTYTLPIMLTSMGLAGVFGAYAVVCVLSWIFVFLKVPETKGMPLEVITEFFAFGARQKSAAKVA